MKKITLDLGLLMVLLYMVACSGPEKQAPLAVQSTGGNVPDDVKKMLVPFLTAKKWKDTFEARSQRYFNDTPITAYTIRAVELLGVLGLPGEWADSPFVTNKFARVYLGIDEDSNFKLFMMPVEGANLSGTERGSWKGGKDLRLNAEGKAIRPGNGMGKAVEDSFVLDLNAPCPKTCAVNELQ